MLRLVIPKGSLEKGTFQIFSQADLPIIRSGERSYSLKISDPRIKEVLMLRPQEIPCYIEEGEFDLGITGYDWIVETGSAVKKVADLQFAKRGWGNVKIVLATDNSNSINNIEEINTNSRVITEYPRITRRFFKRIGKGKISIRGSYGATEVKVPRLAEYLVDVTETGETLRQNGKKILAVILESSTKLIANIEAWNDPEKRQAIEEIATLLKGVLVARGKVLIKMNVLKAKIEELLDYLPALRPPTISAFFARGYSDDEKEEWLMVETVVEKSMLNEIIPKIKGIGVRDILEVDISKMIP